MIRNGQAELQSIRDQVGSGSHLGPSGPSDITTPIERTTSHTSLSRDQISNPNPNAVHPRPASPAARTSFEVSRQSPHRSRTPSRTASPSFRNHSAGMTSIFAPSEEFYPGGRSQSLMDENAYYQAETQNLTRENQMLRQRIRELGMGVTM